MTVTDMYVWRGNGYRYVKQRRTIASIDDRTDGNNRPNNRYWFIDRSDDENGDDDGDARYDDADDYNNIDRVDDGDIIDTECLSTTICKTLMRCSRCAEAIRNGASSDLTASGGAIA